MNPDVLHDLRRISRGYRARSALSVTWLSERDLIELRRAPFGEYVYRISAKGRAALREAKSPTRVLVQGAPHDEGSFASIRALLEAGAVEETPLPRNRVSAYELAHERVWYLHDSSPPGPERRALARMLADFRAGRYARAAARFLALYPTPSDRSDVVEPART